MRWTLIFDRPTERFQDTTANRVFLKPSVSHTPSIFYWNEVSLTSWLKKHRPDYYFSPDGFIPLRTDVRCIPVVHDIAPIVFPEFMRKRDLLYYRLFQKRMIQKAPLVFTVSEFSKNEICERMFVNPKKIHVAYNGLHSGFLSSNEMIDLSEVLKVSPPYFLYYGSVHPRKNIDGLIKSFEIYRSLGGQAGLVIAGRNAWKAGQIDQMISSSPHANAIQRIQYLEASWLNALLRKALALVYISHYEGFGLPVLEAMSAGVPVITSQNSSMSEIGENAVIVVNKDNYNQIALALRRLETDDEKRKLLVKDGLQQATKFSYKASAQAILKVLKENLQK